MRIDSGDKILWSSPSGKYYLWIHLLRRPRRSDKRPRGLEDAGGQHSCGVLLDILQMGSSSQGFASPHACPREIDPLPLQETVMRWGLQQETKNGKRPSGL